MAKKTIAAGAFKQGCLALIDEVAASKHELVITKRGTPVARLCPIEDPREHERRLLSSWRGKAKQRVSDDVLLEPSSALVAWHAATEGGDDA
jgi:prevent-host-death family protein